ncbi:MAG TPA: M12 family metallo-peptidase [Thermoanaerobaculia bacterium]|nr:M12 family metallo-peptidase [Thermoanaerobaculia bacterium]
MRKLCSRFFVAALVVISFAVSSSAGTARELNRNVGRLLATMPENGKVTLRDLSLGRKSLDTIELEPMEVWAKDAKIIAYGPAGEETLLAPPDVKYFKGRVKGEEESAVFFSRSRNGSVRGMVLIGERRWVIGTGVRQGDRPVAAVRKEYEIGPDGGEGPLLISEIDEIDDLNDPTSSWQCDVGKHAPDMPVVRRGDLKTEAVGIRKPVREAGDVEDATYQLRIAVETDDELGAAFGNNTNTLTTYIGDLFAKASIVYSRDLSTTLVLGQVNLRVGGAGTDPWTFSTGSGTAVALAEFGTYWHTNYPIASVPRSSAVFISGRNYGGGIAWLDVLCDDDFYCGSDGSNCNGGNPSATYANKYGGGYAFNGQAGSVTTTVPDPTLTVNGVQYGLPTTSNFWILLEVMHELGHNVASPHSSCVALSAEEKALYGVTRNFVDICLSSGGGCYSGAVSAPTEKGTIMSYCHNISSGGFRQSRYLFGKAGEASEKMLPIFKGSYDDEQPWFATGLEGSTPDPTITVQTPPVACAAGRTASVPSCSGCTYEWSIDSGVITSVNNIAAIIYTPLDEEVTLTVTVITARGCGISASKTFTASCIPPSAPENVIATATSTTDVNVSWDSVASVTSYNVYRSTDGSSYSLAGNVVAPTVTFNDSGRTVNTGHLYKVRAVNGSGESADSNIDLATTVIFTDDPLVGGTSGIQALHLTQLRTAVDAVRTLASLGAFSYTDPAITAQTTAVKADHVNDLRSALDDARSTLTLAAISYGETVTASTTTAKTSHFTELRNGVK